MCYTTLYLLSTVIYCTLKSLLRGQISCEIFVCQNGEKKKELTEIIKKIETAKMDKICVFSGKERKDRGLRRDPVSGRIRKN